MPYRLANTHQCHLFSGFLLIVALLFMGCGQEPGKPLPGLDDNTPKGSPEDSTRLSFYLNTINRLPLYAVERQKYLDSALLITPNSAYLWQQKAMPLYKERKFQLGKPFLEKAAALDPESYLDYSAFLKGLFANEHRESIREYSRYIDRYGPGYLMDHTHDFYIALNYLQLNEFQNAKLHLEKSREQQFNDFPEDPAHEACHYLDWFYLGVVAQELENHDRAISHFNRSLRVYRNFADALFYKAISLKALGRTQEAERAHTLAMENKGNTINEDQVFYLIYPYQIFHKLNPMAH